MNQHFPSRRDWILGSIVWLPLVLPLFPMLRDGMWPLVAFMLLMIAFVGMIWFGTGYVLSEDELTVKIGPFVHTRVRLADIRYISRTGSWMASPANSLRRWRIAYGKWDEVIVSPEREDAFFCVHPGPVPAGNCQGQPTKVAVWVMTEKGGEKKASAADKKLQGRR